jgi:hypothetical protein
MMNVKSAVSRNSDPFGENVMATPNTIGRDYNWDQSTNLYKMFN